MIEEVCLFHDLANGAFPVMMLPAHTKSRDSAVPVARRPCYREFAYWWMSRAVLDEACAARPGSRTDHRVALHVMTEREAACQENQTRVYNQDRVLAGVTIHFTLNYDPYARAYCSEGRQSI